MPVRRPTLPRRLLAGAVGVVSDRVPWLSERAYRAVSSTLQWIDSAAGARLVDSGLDDVRDRVAALASSGRVRWADLRRIERSLARARADLERVAPRLPVVPARRLALRLDAYTEALAGLSGGRVTTSRSARARDAMLATGTAAGTWMGLMPVAGGVAVQGGLTVGVATAVGATVVRRSRGRRQQIQAVAECLVAVDDAVTGPQGVDVGAVDRDRGALLRRALGSGRLDARGTEILRRIDAHLDDLLVRLVEGGLEVDSAYLVQASVARYLPDTLEPLLALADPRAIVRGRPVAEEVADQLAVIEGCLADVAGRPRRSDPATLLLLQGEFLRTRFGGSSL
jgi:hypothetical protein